MPAPDDSRPPLRPRRRVRAISASGLWLTALSTALLTGLASWFAFRSTELASQNVLERLGSERVHAWEERMDLCRCALSSVDSFFAASDDVRRDELELFTANLLGHLPEITGLAWIPGEGTTWGATGAVHLLHDPRREQAIEGIDAAALPGWSAAMDAAASRGAPVMVQGGAATADRDGNRWILVPVGDQGAGGFFAGRVDLSIAAESSAVAPGRGAFDLYLFEGEGPSGSPVVAHRLSHSRATEDPPAAIDDVLAGPHHVESFSAAGIRWTAVYARAPESPDPSRTWVPWGVLAGGVLSTLVLLCLHRITTSHTRSLRAANVELEQEVERRRASEAALAVATREAQTANEAKARFLACMNHELRTPLNGVLGMAQCLEDTPLDDGQRDLLAVLRSSADLLLGLVGDVLDFTQMEGRSLRIREEELDLRRTVEETVEMHAERAAAKGLDLTCHFDPRVPGVVGGDAMRLRQVVLNLVGNAVKFTDEGGVDVRVILDGRGEERAAVLVVVDDTGPGVPDELVPSLFQPFTQADDSQARRHGGMGLGLSVAKEIVDLMGGEIGIENRAPSGCRAWIRLRFPVLEYSAC